MLIPTCVIKFVELVLVVACLTLHQYSYDLTDLPTFMLCTGTFVGYVIVLSGEILGEVMSASADAYVDAFWSALGALLHGTCGALMVVDWLQVPQSSRRTQALACAVCALVAAATFAIDSLLAACSAYRDDTSSKRQKKQSM